MIRRHAPVQAGFATQTPQFLLVPVLRQAQWLDQWDLAARFIHAVRRDGDPGAAVRR